MSYPCNMIFATNDSRSRHLEAELKKCVGSFASVGYDPVQLVYKYAAAAFTYNKDRKVWWNRFQWHPLMQAGRRHKLIQEIKKSGVNLDCFLMWGSWFNPFCGTVFKEIPFYVYIDQSCNNVPDAFDICSDALDKSRRLFNQRQFITYQHCKTIFCMSDWARRQTLESHDIPEDKVIKVGWGPIGVNLLHEDIFCYDQEPTVLFVGHEFYRKGVDILRAAIPEVVKEVPQVKFKVVGGNSDGLRVEPHPNLEIMGTVCNIEKMKDLYRNAMVFVLPHRFDRSPHVLVEAMSAGKPIITSKQGGAIEVVEHGKTGFLIEVGDIAALAQHITTLVKSKSMCLAFGEEGRKIMARDHTWDAIAKKMLAVIEKTK